MQKINNFILVFSAAAIFNGCGREPDKTDYVARVNDSYLMKSELEEMTDTSFKNNFYKNEIIRNWIDEELLYQQAINEGVIEEKEFRRILNNSHKALAGALLLQQVSDKYKFTFKEDDLEIFYQENKDEFALSDNAYLLNKAEFPNEDEAIAFRISVLQKEWQSVIEARKNKNLIVWENNFLLNENDIYPLTVRNLLQELYPQEISIVVKTDTSKYAVYQLVEKYNKGTIPGFNLIKARVEKRFILVEKRKFINEYIKKLYADNDIEVKTGNR